MDRHIKNVIGNYLKESKIGSGYTTEKILTIWNDKMGSSVAAQTRSMKFKNGVLKIDIISSVLKYELFQNAAKIKEVLNAQLDNEAIEKIIFI